MINTLFSWFAFVWIIISIMMQSEELKLQREELRATRDEFEEQSKVFRMDLFEKSFYNLLDELGKSITNFQIKESHLIEINEQKSRNSDRKVLTGRTGLGELLARWVNENCDVRVTNVENKMDQVALKCFLKMKYNPSEEIRIYLRTLDLIVTIIDKKVVDVSDREFYSSILKCWLSRIERDMIDLYIEGINKIELLRCYKEVF